jgi:hypothetical protein
MLARPRSSDPVTPLNAPTKFPLLSTAFIDHARMLSIQHRERRSFLAVEQFIQYCARFLLDTA